MSRFLSRKFAGVEPYVPGEQPRGGSFLKLNTNENPYPPSPRVLNALSRGEAEKLHLYSDPAAAGLVGAIAARFGLAPENVFVGNGSDEVLAFSFLAFGGDAPFLCPALSYGFYPVFARLLGARYEAVPLREDFSLDAEAFVGCGKNVVIANPNAPTGLAVSRQTVRRIARSNPDRVVVIDEAYVDFGGESAVPLVPECDNLLVVQTFSKSRALAGMRIGFALGNPALIADLNTMKFSFNPYNLDRLALLAGQAAIADEEYLADCTRRICATRAKTAAALRALGFAVTDSKANFLFVRPRGISGPALFAALRARGVLVRRWDDPEISDWLRVTIGSEDEMARFVAVTGEILQEAAR